MVALVDHLLYFINLNSFMELYFCKTQYQNNDLVCIKITSKTTTVMLAEK